MGVIAVLLVVVAVISSHPAAASSDTAAPAPAPVLPPLAARLHRAFSITLDGKITTRTARSGLSAFAAHVRVVL
jgi:hypothetical protein